MEVEEYGELIVVCIGAVVFFSSLDFQSSRRHYCTGIDYDNDDNAYSHIPKGWWLEGKSCKWKSDPTAISPGVTRAVARK